MTLRPRLWVVSELYYPEETSTGYFLTRIAEGLAGDYDVRVISGRPAYSERHLRVSAREARAGTRIYRMPATRFDKDRLGLRLINLLSFSLSAFCFALARIQKGDLVLVVTNPPSLPVVMCLAAKIKRGRLLLLMHDVYPEALAATGILKKSSAAYRLLAGLFRVVYRRFERIIVLGRDAQDIVAQKTAMTAARLPVIPNWGDTEEIFPLPRQQNPFRSAHGLDGKIIIQFSGNIGRTHDVETLLEVAQRLQADPRFHFLFVGAGGKAGSVQREIARRGLANITLLPRQPREKLNQMLNASDATLIGFIDEMYGLSVPSRMYNVMAAGVPILALAHPRSELALVVTENQAGWALPNAGATALYEVILGLGEANGLPDAQARGARGRAAVERHYTLAAALQLFRHVLGELKPD